MLSTIWTRRLQYAFIAIVTVSVGFSLYQWNQSRASTNKTAPNNGLIGYWSFNEGTGTLAGDSSVNKNTGTLTNGPTWVAGKLGQALNFDGVNDYVTISSSITSLGTQYSIGIWAKWDGTGGSGFKHIIDIRHNVGQDVLAFRPGNSDIFIRNSAGVSVSALSITYPSDNSWHYYTLTTDGVTAQTYRDATPISSASWSSALSSLDSWKISGISGDLFKGSIDEVRVYNRALSGTEVTNLYNLGAAKLSTTPTANLTSGLVGYWTFDGKDTPWSSSSAGTATDRSGNSNTGTLTNMNRSTSPIFGKIGQALNFDGSNDSVTVPDNSSLEPPSAITMCAWVNPASASQDANAKIISKDYSSPRGSPWASFALGANFSGNNRFVVQKATSLSSNTFLDSNVAVVAGAWTHFCSTYNGVTWAVYIDGTLRNTIADATGLFYSTGLLTIGTNSDISEAFDGSIDEVRIYNRALSAPEVAALYNSGR